MSRIREYLKTPEPARSVRTYTPPTRLERGNLEVGRAAIENIKQLLGTQAGGFVAGTFQHVGGRTDLDPKEWAKVLRVREASGEHLSIVQKESWRVALGVARDEPAE
jgi:hypothetical protein